MTLKTCGKAGCSPIEQIRGDIGPGDYHDVIAANPPGTHMYGGIKDPEGYGIPEGSKAAQADGVNRAHIIEMNDDIKGDFRICCSKCGMATPWNKFDAAGMPGIGKVFTTNLWDKKIDDRSA